MQGVRLLDCPPRAWKDNQDMQNNCGESVTQEGNEKNIDTSKITPHPLKGSGEHPGIILTLNLKGLKYSNS